jgi:hypothetical protein
MDAPLLVWTLLAVTELRMGEAIPYVGTAPIYRKASLLLAKRGVRRTRIASDDLQIMSGPMTSRLSRQESGMAIAVAVDAQILSLLSC